MSRKSADEEPALQRKAKSRDHREGAGNTAAAVALIADDDAQIRSQLRSYLEQSGLTVVEAVDGGDAVRRFQSVWEWVSVVVLAGEMTEMSGYDVFDVLRRIDPGVKVIFCSGSIDADLARMLLLKGAVDCLSKPVSLQELAFALNRATGKSGG